MSEAMTTERRCGVCGGHVVLTEDGRARIPSVERAAKAEERSSLSAMTEARWAELREQEKYTWLRPEQAEVTRELNRARASELVLKLAFEEQRTWILVGLDVAVGTAPSEAKARMMASAFRAALGDHSGEGKAELEAALGKPGAPSALALELESFKAESNALIGGLLLDLEKRDRTIEELRFELGLWATTPSEYTGETVDEVRRRIDKMLEARRR